MPPDRNEVEVLGTTSGGKGLHKLVGKMGKRGDAEHIQGGGETKKAVFWNAKRIDSRPSNEN